MSVSWVLTGELGPMTYQGGHFWSTSPVGGRYHCLWASCRRSRRKRSLSRQVCHWCQTTAYPLPWAPSAPSSVHQNWRQWCKAGTEKYDRHWMYYTVSYNTALSSICAIICAPKLKAVVQGKHWKVWQTLNVLHRPISHCPKLHLRHHLCTKTEGSGARKALKSMTDTECITQSHIPLHAHCPKLHHLCSKTEGSGARQALKSTDIKCITQTTAPSGPSSVHRNWGQWCKTGTKKYYTVIQHCIQLWYKAGTESVTATQSMTLYVIQHCIYW